ncbi:MAG: CotH kinase family protein, partial [Muribaculaceae bacterium]|nr:CotH kinase family protein [Muribaculaceae bacterium]
DADGEEIVALVITTKDGRGNRIQISSTLMTVAYDTRPQIYGISIGGIDATKTDKDTFYVKLPYGTDTKALATAFSTNSEISVAGESGPESIDLSNPVKVTATLNGVKRDYTLIAYYSNLPVVYVNTPAPVTSKDEWVKKSTIEIVNAGEYDAVYESAQLKGRGNSTWTYPKKPYAIKLDKKSEVLGMPKHKRWCLLANWMDRTNIRNDVSFEIGRRLPGLAWTPSGRFVDVVFNGKFVGNYYLCEQIKIDSNRVNIDEMTDSDTSGDELTGGYLLELDTYFDEVNKFRSAQLNLPVNFKDPDEDVLQTKQFEYMRDYFNAVEQKLINHADYSEIESLIDIDSFIDWWILYELAGNWEPNHPKSSYMYKKRNGKLYAGPAWDFDYATYTGSTGWYIKGAIWYKYLFKFPEFIIQVKERWQGNRVYLATIPDYIQSVSSDTKASSVYDCQLWPISQNVNGDEQLSFQESADRLKQNYIKRFNWIDDNIEKLTAE